MDRRLMQSDARLTEDARAEAADARARRPFQVAESHILSANNHPREIRFAMKLLF